MNPEARAAWRLLYAVVAGLFILLTAVLVIYYIGEIKGISLDPPAWFTSICSAAIGSVLGLTCIKVIGNFRQIEKSKDTTHSDQE